PAVSVPPPVAPRSRPAAPPADQVALRARSPRVRSLPARSARARSRPASARSEPTPDRTGLWWTWSLPGREGGFTFTVRTRPGPRRPDRYLSALRHPVGVRLDEVVHLVRADVVEQLQAVLVEGLHRAEARHVLAVEVAAVGLDRDDAAHAYPAH